MPQWLIELTGNPKRTAKFGYKHLENGRSVERKFSFSNFKFPACKSCNQNFANLEADAKDIAQKILSEDSLSESELSTLLDWFDKIRIGLWLGYLYLGKNPLAISPHYHIEHRIRQHDRMLAIFKADGTREGLTFFGCDTPSFAHVPSCFSLRINSFYFLNMSYPNLLVRRMGFPFPLETYMMEDERLYCPFAKGRNRIMQPVLKKPISIQGTELYQPMFAGHIYTAEGTEKEELYDDEYVRNNCISWEEGIGRIFIKSDSGVNEYTASPSIEWIPKRTHALEDLLSDIGILTLDWQLYIIDNLQPSLKFLSKEKRRSALKNQHLDKYYTKEMIKILRKKKLEMRARH
ncbi:hypothetical protein ACFLXK_05160 [Chloroflexota bacterium]